MSAMTVALIVFACTLGGALLGLFLRTLLPEHHLRDDSCPFGNQAQLQFFSGDRQSASRGALTRCAAGRFGY